MLSLFLSMALADPCGMVPPLYTGSGAPPIVEREGLQQTYMFFADGVETLAIRPGFTGSVESFGMLVPLPSVPALRKIDDRTFPQLEGAVDPPVVTVVSGMLLRLGAVGSARGGGGMEMERAEAVAPDTVVVVKEEAVGMYEVAVLEAGSSASLKRWMDENSFQFPNGMDATVDDYVAARWMFVAIKAKVSPSSGVEARPGMRETKEGLPPGASFDGFVQGMAFRFEVDEPVIPMRLSGFNGADTHNRVTIVSDRPVQLDGVSRAMVRRQVAGPKLAANLFEPLAVTYTDPGSGGSVDEAFLEKSRDPAPFNGVARDLILSDLLALQTGQLELPHEVRAKEWLAINEALMMRGPAIDAELARVQQSAVAEATGAAREDVSGLTLTVVDGEFPADLLASTNLTVSTYEVPASRNRAEVWGYHIVGPQLFAY